jgi:hypothetical protein
MRARRALSLSLIALSLLALLGGILLPDECADTCSPSCGDCLACGVVALLAAPPRAGVALWSAAVALAASRRVPSAAPRPLDHVPLPPVT